MSSTSNEEVPNKRNILFAIDDSESCKMAFKWYTERIMQPEDSITFVHVMEPSMRYNAAGGGSRSTSEKGQKKAYDEVMNNSKSLGIAYIAMARTFRIESSAFLHVDTRPGRAILTSAKNHNSDMIIMGSSGNGRARQDYFGSVSDYVVHNSPVPVVIIHTQGQT